MVRNTSITILLAVIVAAGGILALATTASAQLASQCTDAAPGALSPGPVGGDTTVTPITGQGKLTVTFKYSAPAQGNTISPIQVNVDAKADNAWTTVVVSPQTFFIEAFQSQQGGFSTDVPVTAQVTFSKDAPAFAKERIVITATALGGTCVGPAAAANAPAIVSADFYERYQVRFEKTVFKTGQNSQLAIPTTIDNLGNGDINVNFKIAEGTSKGLVLALPGQQIVPSTIAGGETNRLSVNIDVKTPFKNGYENRQDQLVIDVAGSSADNTQVKLTPLQVSAVIQTQGVYVPGFEAVTMIGALLGALLVARRRN